MIDWLLLLLAASIPPLNLFPEEHVLPKWMVAIWVVLILLTVYSLKKDTPKRKGLLSAACITVCYICIIRPFQNSSVLAMHLCMLLPF